MNTCSREAQKALGKDMMLSDFSFHNHFGCGVGQARRD